MVCGQPKQSEAPRQMSIFEVREQQALWTASTFSLDHLPFKLNIVLDEISIMYILSEYVRVRLGAQVCQKDHQVLYLFYSLKTETP